MSIDKLLRDTEALPLPMRVLGKMAGKGDRCRVIDYEEVEKAQRLDQIINSQHPYAILLVTDNRHPDSRVGHYVAIWLQGKTVQFFDAYAHRVGELMKLLNNSTAIIKLVREAGKQLVPNRKAVQAYGNKISTCGRHCAIRIRMHDWSHERYYRFLQSKLLNPDQLVTLLTMCYKSGSTHHDALSGGDLDHLYI